jgi:aarF domain-containing kinase
VYHNQDHPVFLILSGVRRFAKTAVIVTILLCDYQWTMFRSKSLSVADHAEALNRVHQRTANRLLWLFRQQGGVYIKAGQHLSSLSYILPSEYTKTLSVLQDDAPQSSLAEVERVFVQELGHSYSEM